MSDKVLDVLACLVTKSGVALGRLAPFERDVALAVAAAALPSPASPASPVSFTEAQVNQALKRCLAEEARWLDTDHVELRRWIIDRGLWQRDGFGRAYRRTDPEMLDGTLGAIVASLPAAADLPRWVAERRERFEAERGARRSAWQQRQASAQAR